MRTRAPLHADRYAEAVRALVRRRYEEWDEAPPTAADIGRPRGEGELRKIEALPGVPIPVDDEDWPARSFAEKAIHALIRSPVYPLHDRDDAWDDPSAAADDVRAWLGDRLVPGGGAVWDDPLSDDAQSRFAFAGLGAGWLRVLNDDERRNDPDRASFSVDASWLARLEVRPGFERFGARALFDDARRIVRIDRTSGASRPGDPAWGHAKFAWRSSVLVGITLSEHVHGIHLDAGNGVVTAARERLPREHPLRLFLKPFTYRTVSINHRAAAVLAAPRGLLHRAFALTWDGMLDGMRGGHATLERFPSSLASRGVSGLDAYPYGEDGVRLYAAIERYVDRFTSIYFPDAGVSRDPDVEGFWRTIARARRHPESPRTGARDPLARRHPESPRTGARDPLALPDAPLETRRQLVDVLSAFVFAATGLHKHVGSLREYLLDPRFVSTRIRPGEDANDVQGSLLTMLVVAGTGLEQPALLSDFHHLLPRAHEAEAAAALDAFMADLRTLASDVDRANATRRQAYHGFCPSRLECSVSI